MVIEREVLEAGEFTEDSALAPDIQVLDGNLWITEARRLSGGDHLVSCRVHYALPMSVIKIVADREYYFLYFYLRMSSRCLRFELAQVYPIFEHIKPACCSLAASQACKWLCTLFSVHWVQVTACCVYFVPRYWFSIIIHNTWYVGTIHVVCTVSD